MEMKTVLAKLRHILFPKRLWSGDVEISLITVFAKFIIFDIIWGMMTSMIGMVQPLTYINTFFIAFLFVMPYGAWRSRIAQVSVDILLDIWLIANLLYARNYTGMIPASSYALAGNLADFTTSVFNSFRVVDLLFPATTAAQIVYYARHKMKSRKSPGAYFATLGAFFLIAFSITAMKGGFMDYHRHISASPNRHATVVQVQTLPGNLIYDIIEGSQPLPQEDRNGIERWLATKKKVNPLPDGVKPRRNLVWIICESLEAWPVGIEVEGHEIMPFLNSLVARDEGTIYFPNMLTQTGAGHSIDCQLLINAGLIPSATECYSFHNIDNTYFTVSKAMKELKGAKTYLLTTDGPNIWNQGKVAEAFGLDAILWGSDWSPGETDGDRLTDSALMDQIIARCRAGELWKEGETAFVQIVLMTGHDPEEFPERLRRFQFSDAVPFYLSGYLNCANFVDGALKKMVDYVESRSDAAETLVLITGDHEGLHCNRKDMLATELGAKIVSPRECSLMAMVNSPVTLKSDGIIGQIDVYPTLLQLLGLTDYCWHGLGHSILGQDSIRFAVGQDTRLHGNTEGTSPVKIREVKTSREVSSMIIKHDLLKKPEFNKKNTTGLK